MELGGIMTSNINLSSLQTGSILRCSLGLIWKEDLATSIFFIFHETAKYFDIYMTTLLRSSPELVSPGGSWSDRSACTPGECTLRSAWYALRRL